MLTAAQNSAIKADTAPGLTVKLPPRRTDTTVNRDRNGEMAGSTAIETDYKE